MVIQNLPERWTITGLEMKKMIIIPGERILRISVGYGNLYKGIELNKKELIQLTEFINKCIGVME